jgi:hypothetical protein
MGIFTTPPTKSWANNHFDALWDKDYDLATQIRHEAMAIKAKSIWAEEGFIMFIDNIEWEEIDGSDAGSDDSY